jgi:hypothetical protein
METWELVLTLIGPFAAGAIGSTLLWLVFGIPRISKKIEAKEVELKEFYRTERDKTVKELLDFYHAESTEAMGRVSLMLQEKLPEMAVALAPILVQSLISGGAALMANKSNGEQSMAKASLGTGLDLDGILSKLQGGGGAGGVDLGGILSQLQGGGGGGSPANPLTMILSQFVPKKYQSLLSAIMPQKPQQSTAAAYSAQGGNGGYSPGIGRH